MTYHLTTLENGLRVASETFAEGQSAAFAIAVDVGARHETASQGGLSHMLEHMAFKGTSKMSAKEIAETFDMMGGHVNAYTSHEHTVYYVKVMKEYAGEALRLLCEIVVDSVFDQAELERERQVILQEIAMHQDSPDDLVFDLFQEMAFGDTPLGRSILGRPERVATFSREDLIEYTQTHYQPRHIVIAGAGGVDHKDTVAVAEQFFGKRKNGDDRIIVKGQYFGGEKTLEKDLEQVQLTLGFNGVASTHKDYYAAQVFTTILGGGMSSRLFQEIREKRGLAYSVSAYTSGYQDIGLIGIYAGTTVEHLPELTGALREVLGGMKAEIGEQELRRAKNQIKSGVVMSRENAGRVAEWIARHLLVYGRYRTAEELLQTIEVTTSVDMARLATNALATEKPTIGALGPIGSVNEAGLTQRLAA